MITGPGLNVFDLTLMKNTSISMAVANQPICSSGLSSSMRSTTLRSAIRT